MRGRYVPIFFFRFRITCLHFSSQPLAFVLVSCSFHSFSFADPSCLSSHAVLVFLKFQGLKSDHILARPTPLLVLCICMQAGEGRGGAIVMVSQSTELVLSSRAAQVVKQDCGSHTLHYWSSEDTLILKSRS